MSLPIELEDLKKQLSLRIVIDGPASWATRGLIEDVDEYVLSTLDMLLSENLPEDVEYEIQEDTNLCSIEPSEPDCERTLVVALYRVNEENPIAYIIFNRIIGDNTYEFSFRKIIIKQT
ncbi:hypothetical protein J4526_01060 [Desulfurococcaceae archaeon MEX13E-LK6-19]|nr:hypothetical protein J4526_01060 [Desulfurococcaceae archaeon MEX13E-LK6-19]